MRISRFMLCLVAGSAFGLAACGGDEEEAAAVDTEALQAQVAELEKRKSLVQDANDIKRLQRAYGYYLDEALWDEMLDLFTDDATVEYGLDGVYVGKDRIRDYFYALGGGKQGLSHGQLNEHMQLMPVVTVAPDGMTAKGRWRALIMAGEYGEYANWGEGPYEIEYRKEDGVWKISKLHWYETIMVPYEKGWGDSPSVTQGKYVSDQLPPDMPPSENYEPWPGTYLPPFHFDNPVTGEHAGSTPEVEVDVAAMQDATPEGLARKAAVLAQEIELLEDENKVENLQRIYGFYVDKSMWTQVADLFAEDGTLEIGGRGVFVGKERVLEYLRFLGSEFPQDNRLYDHTQMQPVVHVSPDGKTAKGRWRAFIHLGVWHEQHRWGMGHYENEYVKEDGAWKIKTLHAYFTMYTDYDEGWGKSATPNTQPEEELPPDLPPTVPHETYPSVFIVPFHYENPVTGAPVYAGTAADYAEMPEGPVDPEELAETLDALDRRLTLLEDADQIERLHAIYGYYLARNQWDELAAMFAEDGVIEIALRGRYVGPESIRRSLDLYGEPGVHPGVLHNHMQYQPVIHVAEDGQTAKMRSRAFSMLGEYGEYAMWMGGVYENEFVKQDGVWKLKKDQVFNTYFAPYDVGWRDLEPRDPPGVSSEIPPDLPPSVEFEMYPKAFLPPYHYPHPVTGKRVVWPPVESSTQ